MSKKTVIEVEEVQTPKQTIFDPRDLSIQLGRKGKCSWVGSKCHVVETAVKGKINFVTNMIYQAANRHDKDVHDQLHSDNRQIRLSPAKLFADTSYVTGETIKKWRERGVELMGYVQGIGSPREKEFLPDAFEIDFENRMAVCPAGHRNTNSAIHNRGNLILYFDSQTCQQCQFFDRCVRATSKKTPKRILTVGPYYPYTRERRIDQKTAAFRSQMPVRAQVEGTISEATRFHGLRHARYHGRQGHELQFFLTGAAININRIARAIRKGDNKRR